MIILIKECNVILHNDKVAVVVFEGRKIQVPNSDLIGKTAYVKFEDGKYTVVSKDELDKPKKKFKKETVKVAIEPVVTVEETEDIVIDNEENIE